MTTDFDWEWVAIALEDTVLPRLHQRSPLPPEARKSQKSDRQHDFNSEIARQIEYHKNILNLLSLT